MSVGCVAPKSWMPADISSSATRTNSSGVGSSLVTTCVRNAVIVSAKSAFCAEESVFFVLTPPARFFTTCAAQSVCSVGDHTGVSLRIFRHECVRAGRDAWLSWNVWFIKTENGSLEDALYRRYGFRIRSCIAARMR